MNLRKKKEEERAEMLYKDKIKENKKVMRNQTKQKLAKHITNT